VVATIESGSSSPITPDRDGRSPSIDTGETTVADLTDTELSGDRSSWSTSGELDGDPDGDPDTLGVLLLNTCRKETSNG